MFGPLQQLNGEQRPSVVTSTTSPLGVVIVPERFMRTESFYDIHTHTRNNSVATIAANVLNRVDLASVVSSLTAVSKLRDGTVRFWGIVAS